MRSVNKRGRLVAERLAYASGVMADIDELPEWVEDGEGILNDLRAAMHAELDVRSLDERRVQHWQKYGRGIEGVLVTRGVPSLLVWLVQPGSRERVADIASGQPAF
jgi:hypothetical protein